MNINITQNSRSMDLVDGLSEEQQKDVEKETLIYFKVFFCYYCHNLTDWGPDNEAICTFKPVILQNNEDRIICILMR